MSQNGLIEDHRYLDVSDRPDRQGATQGLWIEPGLKSQFNGQPITGTLSITTIICSANPDPVLIVSQEDINKSLIFFTGDYQELAIPIVAR